jgi:hypothetical protein
MATKAPFWAANRFGVKVPDTVPPLPKVPSTADVIVPAAALAGAGAAAAGLPTAGIVASATVPASASLAMIPMRMSHSFN